MKTKNTAAHPATTWVIWLCSCQTVGWCLSVSLAFIVQKELNVPLL